MISCRRAISDTTAPGAYDSATIRPLSSSLHRRRRPTPLRISTRPRGAVASTIWSTIYANRSCQHRSHLPNYAALRKMGAKHRLPYSPTLWALACVRRPPLLFGLFLAQEDESAVTLRRNLCINGGRKTDQKSQSLVRVADFCEGRCRRW